MIEQVMDLRPQTAVAVQAGFDYGQIDEGIRDEVKQAARSIRQLEQGVITGILAIGKRLIEVKDMIPHGQFAAWVLGEFGMEDRTAQRMMSVAKEYSDPQKRQTLTLFSPSVAYMLAAPSTPPEARTEVEQAASSGQRMTVAFAEKTIAKHKPAPVERLRPPKPTPTPEPARAVYVEPRPEGSRPVGGGILTGAWIEHILANAHTDSADFKSAVLAATVAQLEDAIHLCSSNDDKRRFLKLGNRRELLLLAKDAQAVDELIEAVMPSEPTPAPAPDDVSELAAAWPAMPDPRLGQARLLRQMLVTARDCARADYGELTGRHTDLLEFERAINGMLAHLDSLVEILTEKG